jgi:hypothetical protein
VRPVERRLSTASGDVLARCEGSTVYLVSWSPAQGYQVDEVDRGPGRFAMVVFEAGLLRRAVHVACSAGTPALVVWDDGGVDHW